MLIVVIGDNKIFRQEKIRNICENFSESELIILDDTMTTLSDLEQYAYPSLFSIAVPVVQTKYILDGKFSDLNPDIIKKLHAAPTIFIIEEFALPATSLTQLKKHGVEVHAADKVAKTKKEGDIFSVTKAIIASDKKARWFAYREAITEHPVEAIMGILYWKVRDLVNKGGKDKQKYLELYRALIRAHAKAWETGAPLELLIEKVILEQ